eukprot:TRINITY_DN15420_c2_g1_i1.p1 TRINITY_DN15420_c2_g1~~TRINITY_DN15420_c2_g1_i1.p1  ORF type:complete len:238 (+),score=39.33 TRINITY_DN15420_c2_g1_i1:42-716(+)
MRSARRAQVGSACRMLQARCASMAPFAEADMPAVLEQASQVHSQYTVLDAQASSRLNRYGVNKWTTKVELESKTGRVIQKKLSCLAPVQARVGDVVRASPGATGLQTLKQGRGRSTRVGESKILQGKVLSVDVSTADRPTFTVRGNAPKARISTHWYTVQPEGLPDDAPQTLYWSSDAFTRPLFKTGETVRLAYTQALGDDVLSLTAFELVNTQSSNSMRASSA